MGRALGVVFLLAMVRCTGRGAGALDARVTSVSPDANSIATVADRDAGASPRADASRVSATVDNDDDDGRCESRELVRPAAGVVRAATPRGPALDDLWITRRGRWLGATRTRLCASDDDGRTFRERLVFSSQSDVTLEQADRRGPWLVVAKSRRESGATEPARVLGVWVTTDEEARSFEPIELPSVEPGHPLRDCFTDRRGTLFASSDRALYRRTLSDRAWRGPLRLPGREARSVDACGRVLLAVARVDDDGEYRFRSFDDGERWSPFRLGLIGIDSDRAVVRCLGARGAIEAGRTTLPTHWSFDGGRTWSRSEYDDRARRIARERGPDAVRCRTGPGDTIECRDDARVRLLDGPMRDVEIYAPGRCERITQLDTRTTVAFGPSCGVMVSGDRGGLWRQRAGATVVSESTEVDGRGGLIDRRAAWRIDGSIWWTFDGGARWTPVASVIGRTLVRGVFVDRRRGVFVTSAGWVVATRDGGRTFTHILQGEVERISAEGTMVYVTTPRTVRVSPDGGVRWWAPGVGSGGARVRPSVEREGETLVVHLSTGVRVEQRGPRIELSTRGARAELATLGDASTTLIAADSDPRVGVRALLSDGTILRLPPSNSPAPSRSLARRTTRRRRAR